MMTQQNPYENFEQSSETEDEITEAVFDPIAFIDEQDEETVS